MGSYVKSHVAIFVPESQECLVEKLVSALKGEQGPFDFARIIDGGPEEGGIAIFAQSDLAGQISDLDEHYGYSEMGHSTMIEWTFETKWYAPPDIIERVASCVAELGLGLRWHCASDNHQAWNPIKGQYEDHWEQVRDVVPGEITETMRAMQPALDLDFSRGTPEP